MVQVTNQLTQFEALVAELRQCNSLDEKIYENIKNRKTPYTGRSVITTPDVSISFNLDPDESIRDVSITGEKRYFKSGDLVWCGVAKRVADSHALDFYVSTLGGYFEQEEWQEKGEKIVNTIQRIKSAQEDLDGRINFEVDRIIDNYAGRS